MKVIQTTEVFDDWFAGLRDQQAKPTGNYASPEQLKRLADSLKEVDRKRVDDNEKTRAELLKLAVILNKPLPPQPKKKTASVPSEPSTDKENKPGKTEEMAEYVIKSGDTLGLIAQAYREKNVKITVDQILKANPGLVPEKMHVGQKIRVPLSP